MDGEHVWTVEGMNMYWALSLGDTSIGCFRAQGLESNIDCINTFPPTHTLQSRAHGTHSLSLSILGLTAAIEAGGVPLASHVAALKV